MLITNSDTHCMTNVVRKIYPYRGLSDLELRKLIAEKSGLFRCCEILYDPCGFDEVIGIPVGGDSEKCSVFGYEGSLDLMRDLENKLLKQEARLYDWGVNYMAKIENVPPYMISARGKAIAYLAIKDFS